jgi:hypothetical protein
MILSGRICPNRERWLNPRVEMWNKSREWLELRPACRCRIPIRCRRMPAVRPYRYDSLTRLALEKKEDMHRRRALSSDEGGRGGP